MIKVKYNKIKLESIDKNSNNLKEMLIKKLYTAKITYNWEDETKAKK